MEIQITSRNIDIPPEVHRYIKRRLGKLSRHLPDIGESKVEVFEEKTRSPQQRFVVQVTLDSNGTLLRGEERGENLLEAINKVVEVVDRQVKRYKDKLYDKGRGSSLARGGLNEAEGVSTSPSVVKVKRFAVKPMSMAEAIDQMELLGHDFFLFFNADTEEINLLYRRKDNNYGLIEPDMG